MQLSSSGRFRTLLIAEADSMRSGSTTKTSAATASKDRTIKNAVLRGRAFANAKINEKIVARLATVKMEQVEA